MADIPPGFSFMKRTHPHFSEMPCEGGGLGGDQTTVTISGKTFTFKRNPVEATDIQIGKTVDETIANLEKNAPELIGLISKA